MTLVLVAREMLAEEWQTAIRRRLRVDGADGAEEGAEATEGEEAKGMSSASSDGTFWCC